MNLVDGIQNLNGNAGMKHVVQEFGNGEDAGDVENVVLKKFNYGNAVALEVTCILVFFVSEEIGLGRMCKNSLEGYLFVVVLVVN